jgi:hypothetical protein
MTGSDQSVPQGSHPPAADRITALDRLDESLQEDDRLAFKQMRGNFAMVVDGVWSRVKPLYEQMHQDGVRPGASSSETWFPDRLFGPSNLTE